MDQMTQPDYFVTQLGSFDRIRYLTEMRSIPVGYRKYPIGTRVPVR